MSDDDAIELSPWVRTREPRRWVRTLAGADPADTLAWRAQVWRAASVHDPDELLDVLHLPRDGSWLCNATSKGPDGTYQPHRTWCDRMLRRLGYLLPEDDLDTDHASR